MAPLKRQVTYIGNGLTKTPILVSEKDLTGAQSQPSRKPTSIESGSTKPVSLPEALSLLQTLCFDLRSMKCEVSILARGNRVYVIAALPPDTGKLEMGNGHILLNGKPVSALPEAVK